MNKEHIQFVTIREDFNEYEVENGQILKFKTSIADITVEVKEDGKKSLLGIKEVSHVFTNTEIDTSDLEFSPTEQVTEKDQIKELKFESKRQFVNIYETQNHIIMIAPSILKIFLTNKKDHTNSPILRYKYGMSVNTIDKGSLYGQTTDASNIKKV